MLTYSQRSRTVSTYHTDVAVMMILLPKIPRSPVIPQPPPVQLPTPPSPTDPHQLTELHNQQKRQSLHTDAQALEDIGVLQAPGGGAAGSGKSPFHPAPAPLCYSNRPAKPNYCFSLFTLSFFTSGFPTTHTPLPHAQSQDCPTVPQFQGQTPSGDSLLFVPPHLRPNLPSPSPPLLPAPAQAS